MSSADHPDLRTHAGSPDRPALSRLGREQEPDLGRSRDRLFAALLGPRHGLVRHGPRRRPGLPAAGPPGAREDPADPRRDHGRRGRGPGQGDRPLVPGAGSGPGEGNYFEASASCMFVYAAAKGARLGYLDRKYLEAARRGFSGIIEHLVTVDAEGLVHLNRVCQVAGLGGKDNRRRLLRLLRRRTGGSGRLQGRRGVYPGRCGVELGNAGGTAMNNHRKWQYRAHRPGGRGNPPGQSIMTLITRMTSSRRGNPSWP